MLRTNAFPSFRDFQQSAPRIFNGWAAILPTLLLALLLRGISIYLFTYPTGPDYGLHLMFAQQVLETGFQPASPAAYQLGQAMWPLLPGGPMIFGLVAGISGSPVFNLAHVITFFSLIECAGTFALAYKVFKRTDAAIIATLLTAISPMFVDMMTWAGYPNLIALSLYPACFTIWLMYWEKPTARRLILTAIILCGTAYIHHISTLWLAVTLAGFTVISLIREPVATLRKIIPLGIVCGVIGLPVALSAIGLITQQDAPAVLSSVERFDDTRVTWEAWARVITPMGLLLLVGGIPAFLLNRSVSRNARIWFAVFVGLTVVFMFGWLIGLRFNYTRTIYFLPMPFALGGAALILRWRAPMIRAALLTVLTVSIGVSVAIRGVKASEYFEIVTPDVLEAVDWLEEFSEPDDVVVTGTFFGFQIPRLLDRPQLAALTPDLISNAEVLPLAEDATAIMMGLEGMDAALARWNVRFVVVRAHIPDVPDPGRSQQVMNSHPRMRLVFRNTDILIYEFR